MLSIQLIACNSPQEEAKKYLDSGYQLLEHGEYSKAKLQFKNALQIDDNLASAWNGLSLAEEKQGHLDKVYYTLNKVVEIEPDNVQAHLKLGKIILAGNLLDKALKKSDLLLSLAPDNPNVRAYRAQVLLQLSDSEGAKKEANLALKLKPKNIDALTVLALEKISSNDLQGAMSYIDKGLHSDNKNIALQLLKIKVLNMTNNKNGVINVFKTLISQYPENKDFRFSLAEYYISNNYDADAEKIYKKIVNKYPKDIASKQKYIEFLRKEYSDDKAISQLSEYIRKNPNDYELQYQLAEIYIFNKKYNNAEDIYHKIKKKNLTGTNNFAEKNKLALLALDLNHVSEALKIINEVLKVDDKYEVALLTRAKIYIAKGNIDDAVIDLRSLLGNDPENIAALVLLAEAYQKNDSVELANESYNRAIKVDPVNEKIVVEYVNFLVENKQLNLAEEQLQSALEKNPQSLYLMKELAQVYLMNGKWLKAHDLAEYIKKNGNNLIADQILGAVYQGQRQYDQSIEAFKRAYQASPANIQPMIAVVRSYVIAGKREEAISFLESVIKIHPANLYANILLGQGNELNDDLKNAEIYYKNAIKYNPKEALGYTELARFYIDKERYNDAINILKNGLETLPDNVQINLGMARAQEKADNIDAAIQTYEDLLRKDSNLDLASNNLASLLSEHYEDQKSLTRAYDLARKFKHSKNPYFRDTLGWVYYKLGNYTEATTMLQKVVNSLPNVAVFHFHLGMSLLAEGKTDMAKTELEKAIAITDHTFVDKTIAENALKNL